MALHKEGHVLITTIVTTLVIMNGVVCYLTDGMLFVTIPLMIVSMAAIAFTLWFFRNPPRVLIPDDKIIYAPADGKLVVIEETQESEFFNDRRIQVSIFMSPLNVHVNRYPVSGNVVYSKYHKGQYLVAWHPKSSTHNERTTVVVEKSNGVKILMRQIAGAVARRIVCYAKEGDKATQGADMGFIKFGSRVDLFLPLNTKINVQLNQTILGNKTIIGYLE
jgi:phosphatidylserine decarboxylase